MTKDRYAELYRSLDELNTATVHLSELVAQDEFDNGSVRLATDEVKRTTSNIYVTLADAHAKQIIDAGDVFECLNEIEGILDKRLPEYAEPEQPSALKKALRWSLIGLWTVAVFAAGTCLQKQCPETVDGCRACVVNYVSK